jgi:hypothetical protein
MEPYGKCQTKTYLCKNLRPIFTIGCIFTMLTTAISQTIVHPSDASITEQQAAKELRRYIFLRTGTAPALAIADNYSSLPAGDVIAVSANARAIITELKQEYGNVDAPDSDNRMGYIIKSISKDGKNVLVITGADTTTTLNAAYRFAELIGCHFNLAGDVIPDQKLSYPIDISGYDEKAQPWFELRGCMPFHNFIAGPDMWNTADYKSFITQQAKMGLNFFGLHYYFRGLGGGEGPEPHVWIGHKDDVNPDGTVKPEGAYPAFWASSFRGEAGLLKELWEREKAKENVEEEKGEEEEEEKEYIWGTPLYAPPAFTNGADKLFAHDYCASDALLPKVPVTPEEKAANFNNVGVLLNKAFTHAKQLGVKTAIGTEAPLGFEVGSPKHLITKGWIRGCDPHAQARMRDVYGFTLPTSRGKENEAFTKALYEGMFTRIMRTHPLDYFWLWTYETWAYDWFEHLSSTEAKEAIADDHRYCYEMMKTLNAPFKMAKYGWMCGSLSAGTSLEFDDDVPFGTLWDTAPGMDKVTAAGRDAWISLWYEEDWGLMQPQASLLGMYTEVGDALGKVGGAQALIAKHWRINSIAPESAAHAQMSWDNKVPVSEPMPSIADGAIKFKTFNKFDTPYDKHPPHFVNWITTFCQDWARANFGPERANEIGALLANAERVGAGPLRKGRKGGFPNITGRLPSGVKELWPEDGDPTSMTDPRVIDALHLYTEFCKYKDDIVGAGNKNRYMYWYHYFKAQIELARMALLRPRYDREEPRTEATKKRIISTWKKLISHEMQRVRNESELSIIAQLQQNSWHLIFQEELGIKEIDRTYEGANAVRAMPEISQIYEDEDFEQKVIFIGNGAIKNPTVYYREIGSTGPFLCAVLATVGKNVMKVKVPYPGYDFEYYIQGAVGGETVTYPVTGGHGTGKINKTVITVEKFDFGELKPAERVEMTPERVAR